MTPKRLFILAGEASGDLHASNLVKEMKKINSDLTLLGWGGDKMKNAGVQILKELKVEMKRSNESRCVKNPVVPNPGPYTKTPDDATKKR